MSRIYRIKQFADKINISTSTLRRWDASGILKAKRRESGQRFYDESDLRKILKITPQSEMTTVVYCRVSSNNQKDDLVRQVKAMNEYCIASGQKIDVMIKEIGGGMNFKRKHFLQLMDDVSRGKIKKIIIAHKDRLSRFGFDYFKHVCSINGCELQVVNQETLSPEKEMVEDLMAIIHTFSCRLYGLRRYKKVIKDAISISS